MRNDDPEADYLLPPAHISHLTSHIPHYPDAFFIPNKGLPHWTYLIPIKTNYIC